MLPSYDDWKLACPPEGEREDDREAEEPSEARAEERREADAQAADLKGHVRGCCCHECTDVGF